MQPRSIVVALLAVVALFFWWPFGDVAPPPVADGNSTAVAASRPVTEAPTTAPATDAAAIEVARQSAPSTEPGSELAILRGRCVRPDGAPIAGCKVTLRGWSGGGDREAAWLRDHSALPKPLEAPAQTTGADGRFAFTFAPPPPFQFALTARSDGYVPLDGRWSELAPGSDTDLGDLVLQSGVRVVGRVVDEIGLGYADTTVMLDQQKDLLSMTARRGPVVPRWGEGMVTDADGSFRTTTWLRPGNYRVSAADTMDVSPSLVTLPDNVTEYSLTIVAKRPPPMPTIAGRVVDDQGRSVAEASVQCRSTPRGTPSTRTSREGRFVLSAAADSPERSMLVVEKDGFEEYRTQQPIAWNSAGVEIRLVRSPALTIRVTDAAGAAVNDYSVRAVPRRSGRWSGSDGDVRARGPFADGTAVVAGLRTGSYLAIVEFPSLAGLQTLYEPLAMQGPVRLDLRALEPARRTVRLVDDAGLPVADALVQLCEMFDGEFAIERKVFARDPWLRNTLGDHILAVCEAKTDRDGRATLAGSAGKNYGLSLPGPGHTPTTLLGVRLDAAGELTVPVHRGARFFGRLSPPEVVAHLGRYAAVTRPADRLRLSFSGRRGARFPDVAPGQDPASSSTAIADDGAFDVRGIPAGTWNVVLHYLDGPNAGELYSRSHSLGSITLADGDNGPHTLDVGSLLPGTLVGRVLENGLPMADARLHLVGKDHGSPIVTDGEGRFRIELPSGEYGMECGGPNKLVAEGTTVVVRGSVTEAIFAFTSSTIHLRCVDADGKPARDVMLRFEPERQLFGTAPDGSLSLKMRPSSYRIRVLRSAMSSAEAIHKLTFEGMQKRIDDPFAPHLVDVQTLELAPGANQHLRVTLPAAWNR